MAIMRATFFFKQLTRPYGWTETYFNTASDLTSTLAKAKALVFFLVRLRGDQTALTDVRVSDDLVKRDSLIYGVPEGDQVNGTSFVSDIPNTCLLVRLTADPLVRRSVYLRGIPDSCTTDGGLFNPIPIRGSLFDYANQLKTDGWAIKYKDPLVSRFDVSEVFQDFVNQWVRIGTRTPNGFLPNDAITIRGVGGATQVNGNWSVFSVIDATHFTIKLTNIVTTFTGGGYTSKYSFKLAAITDALAQRITHRITGRPFDLPRGRRRGRKLS